VVIVAIVFLGAWDASRQVPSGNGWRILAHQRATGDRNRVKLITDQAGLDAAWRAMRIVSEPLQVDFERSIVAWLTPVGTIACTTRLDDIRFDREHRLVDGAFSLGLTLGCGSPPVGDSFLVALDRDRLPDAPYQLRILGPDPTGVTNGTLDIPG
ncbi:MAG TPA: hypothetical protein VF119_08695, partial [Candidatus Limnocylindrales bacterium]